MTALDVWPVTVRGPHKTNTSGVVTFARMFTRDNQLFIAESRDKGRTVVSVTAYDLPEGAPSMPGKAAKWGPWVYSSCGCASSWNTHTLDRLFELAHADAE